MYDYNLEQARMRLLTTIVGSGDDFYYVEDVRAGREGVITIIGFKLPDLRDQKLMRLDEIQCFEYNIGYWNHGREAVYVVRVPARQNKQGIAHDNLRVVQKDRLASLRDYQRHYTSPTFLDMLKNKYPTFEEARAKLLSKEAVSVAVTKDIAYRYDDDLEFFILEYKGRAVAHGDIDKMSVPTKYQYLREKLENSKLKVA